MKRIYLIYLFVLTISFGYSQQMDLPVTFDDTATINYNVIDFDGAQTTLASADPSGGVNLVACTKKPAGSQPWAGSILATPGTPDQGFENEIPFATGMMQISVDVYSPSAGLTVMFKVEDEDNGPVNNAEAQATTTVAGAWETLIFDFGSPSSGTINLDSVYNKAIMFFNFLNNSPAAGDTLFYWDNVMMAPPQPLAQMDLPVNFDDTATVNYNVIDFDGAQTTLASADPSGGVNLVACTKKPAGSQPWAGSILATPGTPDQGFENEIPFATGMMQISVDVYSPSAGLTVMFKVEDEDNGPVNNAEAQATTTVAGAWETLIFDFGSPSSGTINLDSVYNKAIMFFNFLNNSPAAGDTLFYWDNVMMAPPQPLAQMDLPVNFDDTATVNYNVIDFDGAQTTLASADPSGGVNLVACTKKPAGSQPWAGSILATPGTPDQGFENEIPFATGMMQISVDVYSPSAGLTVMFKVEDEDNGPVNNAEAQATTTVAGAWETLIFDFGSPSSGTINLDSVYNKAIMFFNFLNNSPAAGDTLFYWDNVMMVPPQPLAQMDLPVTFDDTTNILYELVDFGGNVSAFVTDPAGGTNRVVMSEKTAGAQTWAGTSISEAGPPEPGFANAIPFTASEGSLTARVYSPSAGKIIMMKVEDSNNGSINIETQATTSVANAWETLTFDFYNPSVNTLNLANTYDKAVMFFDFGTAGTGDVYYWDDVEFVSAPIGLAQMDLPITFDDTATVDYATFDFSGTTSSFVSDPAGGTNLVVETTKSNTAQFWAGTSLDDGTLNGLANAIPFTASETSMSVRVYSPDAGIPVRLKVEDKTNSGIFVEVDVMTTMVNTWETLTFDFTNHVSGSPALNLANTYDLVTIFFNFGTDGATAGTKTYYWDDVMMAGAPPLAQMDLPVNFDDTATVNYGVIDFGGASSNFSTDPIGGTNKVVCTIKTNGSQPWAGTTLDAGTPKGFATAIPFSATVSKIAVDVYAPASGITMMLKIEDKSVAPNTVFLETQTTTTMANAWETLVFDFITTSNSGGGATLTGTTFDLVSIFYDFGSAGAQDTFYWDNVVLDTTPPCTPQPSTADAGPDQFNIAGTSATLAAVAPTSGTGTWTISSGVGGTITDATLNNTSFTGVAGSSYVLTWTITTACGTSTDDVSISFASNLAQMDLPVTFDDVTTINYSTLDFGGNASMFVIDPTGGTNMVVQSEKTNTADTWAGTTLATAGSPDLGFLNAVPFTATATTMSVKVYSPDAGIPVRLKVEDETDNTVTVETEVMTTVANTWETLVFDFANQATGTAQLDLAKTYDKTSIFFNFGTDGATAGSKTYYWDDVEFGGVVVDPCAGTTPDANILDDFECQGNIGYSFANATWTPNVANPDASGVNTSSMVGEFIHWGAGTDGAFGGALDLGPISLVTNNQLKMDVYTNATAIPITIVLQDAALNTIVESAMTTSATGAWETLTFDMSSASTATNVTNIVLVVNPGTNVQDTIYIDNVIMDGFVTDPCETAVPDKDIMEDFDCQRNLDYQFAEGGFITISNPDVSGINTSDNVGQYTRNNTVADAFGGDFTLAPLDFVSNNQIKMNVWDANAPSMVSVVLQDASGAGLGTVDVFTTTSNVWEDLNFDFSAVPDAAGVSKVVLLFDAGVQADSGQVYLFDNFRMEGFEVSILEIVESDINIYPNPANEILNIDLSETLINEETKISLFSIDGKLVREFITSGNTDKLSIDVSTINQGIYLIELSNKNFIWKSKVLID